MSGLEWVFLFMAFLSIIGSIGIANDDSESYSSKGSVYLFTIGFVFFEAGYLLDEYRSNIDGFFSGVATFFIWFFSIVAIGFCIFVLIVIVGRVISSKERQKEEEHQAFLKHKKQQEIEVRKEKKKEEQKEASRKLAELSNELEETEKRVLNQLYKERVEAIDLLQQKNQQTASEIEDLKRIVSGLSIFDDDFLEQQPRVLEYIDDVIHKGRA